MSLDRFNPQEADFGPVAPGRVALSGLVGALSDHAEPAAALLKALSHEGRLMILCHLAAGEKLRLEGLVSTRRDGKAIHYALRDPRVATLLSCLPGLFAKAA
jgi:hypothetical protein